MTKDKVSVIVLAAKKGIIKEVKKTSREIVLKTQEGRATKITGEQAETLLEAIMIALERLGAPQIVSDRGVQHIDSDAPAHFSYVDAALIALLSGKETAEEIADAVLSRRACSLGSSST
ncbi:MAG: hypothetical protein O2U61_05945 [Candidatus Bathyarchaeota archaeon]|nr:hypothetical protein [Candidatus Bathyarchaeota archaeon]